MQNLTSTEPLGENMILTFHKIGNNKEAITMSYSNFEKIMDRIKNKKVVYLNEYDINDSNQVVITFDDGFKSIMEVIPLLKKYGYPFEVFIVSNFLQAGENGNENYLNKDDLMEIIASGGRLQYHSKSHVNVATITDNKHLEAEIKCPKYLKELDKTGFEYFAYPFWRHNERTRDIVRKYYKNARSGGGFADENDTLDSINMQNSTEL